MMSASWLSCRLLDLFLLELVKEMPRGWSGLWWLPMAHRRSEKDATSTSARFDAQIFELLHDRRQLHSLCSLRHPGVVDAERTQLMSGCPRSSIFTRCRSRLILHDRWLSRSPYRCFCRHVLAILSELSRLRSRHPLLGFPCLRSLL